MLDKVLRKTFPRNAICFKPKLQSTNYNVHGKVGKFIFEFEMQWNICKCSIQCGENGYHGDAKVFILVRLQRERESERAKDVCNYDTDIDTDATTSCSKIDA